MKIESIRLIDLYSGENVPAGKARYTFRLVWRAEDRTLKGDEVNGAMEQIAKNLEAYPAAAGFADNAQKILRACGGFLKDDNLIVTG